MARWTLMCGPAASVLLACLLVVPLPAHAGAPVADAAPATTPPIPRLLLPATGYWYDAARPGTGFALQRRGDVLGLVLYHFSDVPEGEVREADWHLAAGPLQGDTFEAALAHFDGGSCLGCDPFVAAEAEQTGIVVRLVFASAREAMLQVGDGEPRRVVAMPYGVPYEAALATPADLPLPDLRGRWVLEGGGTEGMIRLEQRIAGEAAIEYRGPATDLPRPNASMRCTAERCELWLDAQPATSPEPVFVAGFDPGDITEERMTGADVLTLPLRAFRVPDPEALP